MIENMMTVKEYAEERGKTTQAVYQQLKSKENAKSLEGHVIVRLVGNKKTRLLDQEAIRILDEASRQAPTVIIEAENKQQLEQVTNENKALLLKIAELQEQLLTKSDVILQLTKDNQRLLRIENDNAKLQKENLDMKNSIEAINLEKVHQEEKINSMQNELDSFKPSLFGFYRKR